MGDDDYAPSIGGGLRLKGSKPLGIEKKKKKKNKPNPVSSLSTDVSKAHMTLSRERRASVVDEVLEEAEESKATTGDVDGDSDRDLKRDGTPDRHNGKTETERRHEELKRKRMAEQLLKTGVKTHKQRVEELNRYLSTLSEHHDMPKIGPG